MTTCWRCGRELTKDDEKLVLRPDGTAIRKHFVGGKILRDHRGAFLDVACKGGR